MTREEIKIGIEKNRMALLRHVLAWLCAAAVFARHFEKPLPRRLRGWISTLLFKAELAADLLVEATSYLRMPSQKGNALNAYRRACASMSAPLTLSALVTRLNALRVKLENLDYYAARHAVKRAQRRDVLRRRAALPCVVNICVAGQSMASATGAVSFAPRLHGDYVPP